MQASHADRTPEEASRDAASSAKAPTQIAAAAVVDDYRPPRLGLIHLLVWMFLVAVSLGTLMSFERHSLRTPGYSSLDADWASAARWAVVVLDQIVAAAVVLGLCVLVRDKIRGVSGHLQPGHWLLIVVALDYSRQPVAYVWSRIYPWSPWGATAFLESPWPDVSLALIEAIVFAVCVLAAVRLRHARRWQAVVRS
ncbi:MAG: hypothetical protein JW888_18375 [Pirellulales bacterium]|nr:hypothetical protein [Pirellulales bacterium]